MDTITYKIGNKIYVNMTNRCSNNCTFCVRNNNDGVEGYYLWLSKEPKTEEIIKALGDVRAYTEVVFCGFGEPLYRLNDLLIIADYVHKNGVKTRINTNGQASLIHGENVAKKLKGLIDTVNISLNATDAKGYQEICRSVFGEVGFYAMLDFARECVKYIDRVILSVVDIIGESEILKARKIAEDMGAELKVRQYIE